MNMTKEEMVTLYEKDQDEFWRVVQEYCKKNNLDLKTLLEKEFLSRSHSCTGCGGGKCK